MDGCRDAGRVLRVYGAVAIYYHCSGRAALFEAMGRRPGDIDLATYQKESSKIADTVSSLGYDEDLTVTAFGGGRLVFRRRSDGLHCDVFVGKLEMSHVLSFDKRLELDYPTAPLADLLLSKLQIFKLNEKDIIDSIVLLREHQLGSGKDSIDSEYVAGLCSRDWGLWRTATGNLQKITASLPGYVALTDSDRDDVKAKTQGLAKTIEDSPKSLAWKLRARVGESRKWYNDVEDLFR